MHIPSRVAWRIWAPLDAILGGMVLLGSRMRSVEEGEAVSFNVARRALQCRDAAELRDSKTRNRRSE